MSLASVGRVTAREEVAHCHSRVTRHRLNHVPILATNAFLSAFHHSLIAGPLKLCHILVYSETLGAASSFFSVRSL